MNTSITERDVLIVTDPQRDFCPGGALAVPEGDAIMPLVNRKGYHPLIDSYSAFRENDGKTPTGLTGYLRERGLERVTLCGLATDFCVYFSAIDAREAGFEAAIVLEASRGIDVDGSLERALDAMREAGVSFLPLSLE